MANIAFEKLATPISEAEPCGPDLDMVGDGDFMQFSARIEGVLPKSFLSFDRSQVDFEAEYKAIKGMLARSIDLRLVVPLAKLCILERDLPSFAKAIAFIRDCLHDRWDAVHPQPFEGDVSLRTVAIEVLNDMPDTVLPLQAAPLFKTRRIGPVSYRSHLLAEGKIQGRKGGEGGEDEKVTAPSDVRTAITEIDIAELIGVRDMAAGLYDNIVEIERLYDDKSGRPGALRLPSLRELAAGIAQFLREAAIQKDPSLAPAEPIADAAQGENEQTAAPLATGAVATTADAARALRAAAAYFERYEPSSPARLILAQAEALVGKSFYEALLSLAPEFASQAAVKLGRDLRLTLPIERLSEILLAGGAHPESGSADVPAEGAEPTAFSAGSRGEALQLIDRAAVFFRSREPSSPIPVLLDQARSVAGKDFIGLLRDVLPENALRVDE